jgi:demethylmenaquinone methyltransferase/2-methoxy-6-polyprenyl-1,4-benzoquinol methylase
MEDQKTIVSKDMDTIGPMFDSIARRYDFLNHLLSFGIDRNWRRKAVKKISERFENPTILDVATGTGDLALEAVKLDPIKIKGIDISDKMIEIGRKKIKERSLENLIELINCDSENICFEDNSFDVAMVAFGVRNFPDPVRGLSEMRRVVRQDGLVVVLEFSKPRGFIFKHLYNIYFHYILPFIGAVFSKQRNAYNYLNESVMKFADSEKFIQMMKAAGLSDISQTRLTFGIASIYTGVKKGVQ